MSLIESNNLQQMGKSQEDIITELRNILHDKEEEIRELHSQLDQYKSILSFGSSRRSHSDMYSVPVPFFNLPSLSVKVQPRKTRLMGISAEPQSLMTIQELISTKFPEYHKSEK